jgi:hypothetical protein
VVVVFIYLRAGGAARGAGRPKVRSLKRKKF